MNLSDVIHCAPLSRESCHGIAVLAFPVRCLASAGGEGRAFQLYVSMMV
jgi:hypothetical protein